MIFNRRVRELEASFEAFRSFMMRQQGYVIEMLRSQNKRLDELERRLDVEEVCNED